MEPDWGREKKRFFEWSPAKSLLSALRAYARWQESAGVPGRVGRSLAKRRVQFWCAVSGADIPVGVRIGGGLMLPHPNGVVLHEDVVIGSNCMLMQQVTIGQKASGGVPRLGDGVYVGAGAKVLGPVTIGDGAAIGANAVVLNDVPAHATAVGIPARIVRRDRARAPDA